MRFADVRPEFADYQKRSRKEWLRQRQRDLASARRASEREQREMAAIRRRGAPPVGIMDFWYPLLVIVGIIASFIAAG